MKQLLKHIIKPAFLLLPLCLSAQVDSAKVKHNAFEVYIDYLKLGSFLVDNQEKFEFGAGLLVMDHFRVSFNYGEGEIEPKNAFDNAKYRANGNYFRGGIEYQKPLNPGFFISLGGGYAQARFEDYLITTFNSSLFDEFELERKDLEASWYSIIIGSEMRLNNFLYLGWKFRLRFAKSYDKQSPIDVYTIPGYGRAADKSVPSVSLYLKFALPF